MKAPRSLPTLATSLSLAALLAVAACASSSSPSSPQPQPVPSVPSGPEAGVDAAVVPEADAAADAGFSGKCADRFGRALTEGFGRLDGLVYAVQKPSDKTCVMPNDDHLVLQVMMGGAVYRMVVNVEPDVRVGAIAHALPAPAYAEGWHEDVALDYVTTLGVHSDQTFASLPSMEAIVERIAEEVKVGDPVSVYAESGNGRPESAHLIHRNRPNRDGAIVVQPATAPRFLLFHFDKQKF